MVVFLQSSKSIKMQLIFVMDYAILFLFFVKDLFQNL